MNTEIKFKNITSSNGKLYGLTHNGDVYEYVDKHRSWSILPMNISESSIQEKSNAARKRLEEWRRQEATVSAGIKGLRDDY